jgi:hypothetical protein
MSVNSNDQRQNHGRERAEAAAGGGGDAPGNNSNVNNNSGNSNNNSSAGPRRSRRPRRPIVRGPPPPFWRREDDGRMERVDRTPLNVLLFDLDDPFPENGDDDDDDEGGGRGGGGSQVQGRPIHGSSRSSGVGGSYDSSESDDENNLVDPGRVVEPGLASFWLSNLMTNKYRRYRLRELAVSCGEDDLLGDDPNGDLPGDFREFARAFTRYGRIRVLHLVRFHFGRGGGDEDPEGSRRRSVAARRARGGTFPWEGEVGRDLSALVEDGCLEGFFGTALCQHRSLEEIAFLNSRIPTPLWRLLTENLVTAPPPLLHLSLELTPLTMEHCLLLKRMLQRKAPLPMLSLVDCDLGAEEWTVVGEGVAGSAGQVDFVTLSEEDGVTVGPDTLLPLLHAPSAIAHLTVCAPHWSEGALEKLVRALRTNECLREVTLEGDREFPGGARLVEELLATYNCTLKEVTLHPWEDASQGRIHALLKRNQQVRLLEERLAAYNRRSPKGRAYRNHQRVRAPGTPGRPTAFERYHVKRTSVWPRVLAAECGRMPTLLYRFVRHGNLEAFVVQVEEVVAAATATTAAANANATALLSRSHKKKTKKARPPPRTEAAQGGPVSATSPRRKRRRRNPAAVSVLELMAREEAGTVVVVEPAASLETNGRLLLPVGPSPSPCASFGCGCGPWPA